MSRRHALGVLGVLAVLGLAACGGDDGDEPSAPTSDRGQAQQGEAGEPEPSDGGPTLASTQQEVAAAMPEVPVWLPAPLPAGAEVGSVDIHRGGGVPSAQVLLELPSGPLQLQYGQAGLDGCPSDVRPVQVAGQDALMARATPPGKYTTVIWPVRDASDPGSQGIYGISAELAPGRILDLAASMSRYAIPAPRGSSAGC
jgi:hypothetical protein